MSTIDQAHAKAAAPPIAREADGLKRIDRLDRWWASLIPADGPDGSLLPVCNLHRDDARLIQTFAEWRKANSFAFPTQFPVTVEGTTRWLHRGILDNPDRLLFLVLDRHGHPIGQVGLCGFRNDKGEVEAENIVRGVKCEPGGQMGRAMRTLLTWAERHGACHCHLQVFSDNEHAVTFYRGLGFVDDVLLPLRKRVDGQCVFYESPAAGDEAPPDKQFLVMKRSGVAIRGD
jgi:perosamine synthetase